MHGSLQQYRLPALGRYLTVPGLRGFTLRIRLCLIVAIILAPAMILAGVLVLRSIAAERIRVYEGLANTLNRLSVEIDREIHNTSELLVVLAGSPSLQTGDLEKFHRRASEISRQLGIQIVVHSTQPDQRVVSTSVPWNEPFELTMPAIRREAEEQAITTGQIVISDVFFGSINKQLLVSAIIPVTRDGITEYALSIAIPIRRIATLLENGLPADGHIAVVVDRRNTLIACSGKGESYAGTKVLAAFASLASGNGGAFSSTTREGVGLHWVFQRLQPTGWLVAAGVQTSLLEAAARNKLIYAATAGTVLFALVIGLTYLLGGRLEQRVGTLGIDRNPTREEFALFFDSAPNGVVLVDGKGIVLLTNVQIERMFGYPQKDLIGLPVETLIPDELRGAHAGHRQHFARNSMARPMGADRNLRGRRRNGSELPIEVGLFPITIHAAQYTMATVIDITERSRAARALSDSLIERDHLRRHLLRASEDERLRLSHELHDQTGQTLTAATLAAKEIEKSLDADGRQRLGKLNSLLDQMGRTLHQVAWELRPASIDELGLAATLDNYVTDWSDQTGIDAEFYCTGADIDNLAGDVRTTIYRIIQEALTNIAKHAQESRRVSVVISHAGTGLQLTIDDDGDGFDLADKLGKPSKIGSLGIPSMRERLSLIGGTLEIETSQSVGTTIFARIPIESEVALQ